MVEQLQSMVMSDGSVVKYSDRGDGPAVLLIHAGVFADSFMPLAAQPALDAVRVVRLRRAGYVAGHSAERPPDPHRPRPATPPPLSTTSASPTSSWSRTRPASSSPSNFRPLVRTWSPGWSFSNRHPAAGLPARVREASDSFWRRPTLRRRPTTRSCHWPADLTIVMSFCPPLAPTDWHGASPREPLVLLRRDRSSVGVDLQ